MRPCKAVLLIIAAVLLVPTGSSLAHDPAPEPAPFPMPEPDVSPECERQAFKFVDTGFRPVPRNSLTRFRIIGVLGHMDRDCSPRHARIAVFDRRAGTNRAVRVSRWTKATTKRRFVRTVRTRRYRCGFYRAVYAEVAYGNLLLLHTERGARSC